MKVYKTGKYDASPRKQKRKSVYFRRKKSHEASRESLEQSYVVGITLRYIPTKNKESLFCFERKQVFNDSFPLSFSKKLFQYQKLIPQKRFSMFSSLITHRVYIPNKDSSFFRPQDVSICFKNVNTCA